MRWGALSLVGVWALSSAAALPASAAACPGDEKKPSIACPGDDKKPSVACPGDEKKPSIACPGDDKKPSIV